jgi:hypothetical protein
MIRYHRPTAVNGNNPVTESSVTLPPDQGCVMTKSELLPASHLSDLDRPRCPRCHEPRMLHSRTEAGPPSFEYRTFDCQNCGRTHTMIISSDPMEFNVRGWLSGELKAPN